MLLKKYFLVTLVLRFVCFIFIFLINDLCVSDSWIDEIPTLFHFILRLENFLETVVAFGNSNSMKSL